MSGGNLFSLGLTGLNSAQLGMSTTGNNISNAATPGYNRELAIFVEAGGLQTGSGFIGGGVTTQTIQRQFSQTLTSQLYSTQSESSSLSSYSQLVTNLSNQIGDPIAGIGADFTAFFNSLQTLAGSANDGPTRQTVINAASVLADAINSMGNQIDQTRQGINTTISSTVTQINNLTKQIAQLNAQIAAVGPNGQPPNQLLDTRDQAVSQLSQLVGVNVQQASDGTDTISLPNGMTLVQGTQSYQLGTTPSPDNPSELAVTYQQPDSTKPGSFVTTVLPDSAISGGSLGGVLQFRSQTLDPAARQLGALATSFAAQVNAQNELGVDQNGNTGGPLFNIGAPNVIANTKNTGGATVSATLTNPASPPTDDYKLTFDGTNYTVTDATTGKVLGTSTTPPSATNPIGGVAITINGTMAAGDSFTIQPTSGALDSFAVATTDGSAIAASSPAIASANQSNTGTGKIAIGAASSGFVINAPVTLTYDAATGTLTGLPIGSTVTFGNPQQTFTVTAANPGVPYDPTNGDTYTVTNPGPPATSPNGISFTVSGTPADGDTFTIGPNTGGTQDGSNATAIFNVSTSTAFGGTTLTNGYAEFVNNVGNTASNLESMATAKSSTLAQIQSQQQSVSGVNLDEEATNLLEYQQMYQASSKVIQTAQSLFQTILQALG
ncbi:flagellar hook-associated protein FlgK [Paraburkholderia sp. SARCC-3016]|uniref:flagellar hook-associated protein FlgK n=1 Tax=Paraburkholderia sp. SARCC-3016 TaxID=3058611 RepID=UPI0028076A52|nr:flagellar hook-associated protein FlgK [Paraburkholderia sp. SARCC-3016]MDQ7979110.1 flagellar hook-associated protein FlgK [Paraburkholderia sp. SARCC-3016]